MENFVFDTVHSSVRFSIRHLLIAKVHGRFAKWQGTLAFDEANPTLSKIRVEIEAASIDTQEPERDAHLRSADFFDVAKYPKLTFESSLVGRAEDGQLRMTGDLTMRGQTHPVTLAVEFNGRINHAHLGERVGFTAHATVHRKDWGITFNQALETGGLMLGEKVEIQIEVEAAKA
jgi:polyisoprenoid-binding protein YceI